MLKCALRSDKVPLSFIVIFVVFYSLSVLLSKNHSSLNITLEKNIEH